MAKFKITKVDIEANQVSGSDYWFFIYDADKMILKKKIKYVEPDSSETTESKYTIFVADTEQECIDKKIELGL